MPPTGLSTARFRAECERRLIDTHQVMTLLGLRNKASVWQRVEAGKLPPPVYRSANIVALWDWDEIGSFLPAPQPDRKED